MVIEIEGVKKSYRVNDKDLPILDIDHLKIEKGEQVAVIGPSGCGKSTLLHMISGVITPDQGKILLYDEDITLKSEKERDRLRARKIGYIFQDFYLIPSLTVEENIKIVLPKMKKDVQDHLIEEWLYQVGLSERRKHLPAQLSRGQQQRVAIVRSLIHEPDIVLADEPTGSLDYETADKIMNLLLYLSLDGGWFLLIPAPGAECPFDNGDESYWNKIMIVFVKDKNDLRFTSGPLRLKGRLDVGIKVDESNYKTMFRLYDATFEKMK